jgi:CubicO group peptidase (beta-lactamase class C family)
VVESNPKIVELLRRAIRAGYAPAVVAQWGRVGEEALSEARGFSAVVPVPTEVSAETWFDLASLTKPLVTATLTVLAFRSGALAITTRVGEVLREIRGTAVGDLEVGQLLTHTAGLPAWLPLYSLAEGRRDLVVPRLAEVSLQGKPGQQVIYSCVGFVTLGLMLERVGGESLDALFRREILEAIGLEGELGFNPDYATHSLARGATEPTVERRMIADLGMEETFLPPTGYGAPDDGNARFLGGVAGNAGLFGTARGVATLASEYLPEGGSLLTATEAGEAIAIRTEGLEQGRSWGWQVSSTRGCSAGPALSHGAFGHSGFTGVSVWCDPATTNVCVLLTNRNHPAQRENDLHPLRRVFHRLATGWEGDGPTNGGSIGDR